MSYKNNRGSGKLRQFQIKRCDGTEVQNAGTSYKRNAKTKYAKNMISLVHLLISLVQGAPRTAQGVDR